MSQWKPMRALPDFVDCPSSIIVWNDCNGPMEIRVEPDDIYKLREDTAWRMWRPVPRPTEADIESVALKSFVLDLFEQMNWPDGGDLDGFDFQKLCLKHGLLEEVEVTEPCGEECACAEYGATFPDKCFRRNTISSTPK